jgi:hypothetical protein
MARRQGVSGRVYPSDIVQCGSNMAKLSGRSCDVQHLDAVKADGYGADQSADHAGDTTSGQCESARVTAEIELTCAHPQKPASKLLGLAQK